MIDWILLRQYIVVTFGSVSVYCKLVGISRQRFYAMEKSRNLIRPTRLRLAKPFKAIMDQGTLGKVFGI